METLIRISVWCRNVDLDASDDAEDLYMKAAWRTLGSWLEMVSWLGSKPRKMDLRSRFAEGPEGLRR